MPDSPLPLRAHPTALHGARKPADVRRLDRPTACGSSMVFSTSPAPAAATSPASTATSRAASAYAWAATASCSPSTKHYEHLRRPQPPRSLSLTPFNAPESRHTTGTLPFGFGTHPIRLTATACPRFYALLYDNSFTARAFATVRPGASAGIMREPPVSPSAAQ